MCLAVFWSLRRQIARKQSKSGAEGREREKERHKWCRDTARTSEVTLWSFPFDSFLLTYTEGLITSAWTQEFIKLGDLFTVMFYSSCSFALSFICSWHFFIPLLCFFFSSFTKFKWIFFFFQPLRKLESTGKLQFLSFFIFKVKFLTWERKTAF